MEQGTRPVGMFEVILTRRKRFGWRWQVCDQSGKIFADGFERTRPSAKYQSERALFFLLSQAIADQRMGITNAFQRNRLGSSRGTSLLVSTRRVACIMISP